MPNPRTADDRLDPALLRLAVVVIVGTFARDVMGSKWTGGLT